MTEQIEAADTSSVFFRIHVGISCISKTLLLILTPLQHNRINLFRLLCLGHLMVVSCLTTLRSASCISFNRFLNSGSITISPQADASSSMTAGSDVAWVEVSLLGMQLASDNFFLLLPLYFMMISCYLSARLQKRPKIKKWNFWKCGWSLCEDFVFLHVFLGKKWAETDLGYQDPKADCFTGFNCKKMVFLQDFFGVKVLVLLLGAEKGWKLGTGLSSSLRENQLQEFRLLTPAKYRLWLSSWLFGIIESWLLQPFRTILLSVSCYSLE